MTEEEARVLVLTTISADAAVFDELLRYQYPLVHVEIDARMFRIRFEEERPQVLILAMRSVEDSARQYDALLGGERRVVPPRHKTLLLCGKDDVARAYELCRSDVFDDYILFWPMAQDASRLAMSVHHALRFLEVTAAAAALPDLNLHARRLATLETSLDDALHSGREYFHRTREAIEMAHVRIRGSLQMLGERIANKRGDEAVLARDLARLHEELDAFDRECVAPPMAEVVQAAAPMGAWMDRLPAALEAPLLAVKALGRQADKTKPFLLIIDDDNFMRKLLVKMLGSGGFDSVAVASGADAVGFLRSRQPDLILMDVRLPDVDGIELTKQLKAMDAYCSIPVVMLTGISNMQVLLESRQAGAADFLVKPFDRETLLRKVTKQLSMPPSPTV